MNPFSSHSCDSRKLLVKRSRLLKKVAARPLFDVRALYLENINLLPLRPATV